MKAAAPEKKMLEQEQQQQHVGSHQPCCLCAASGHGGGGVLVPSSMGGQPVAVPSITAASGVRKSENSVNSSLGEIATGMMLATGFAHWGWGYGLGWNKPDKPIIG